MASVRPAAMLLALVIVSPALLGLASAANWQPDGGDWSGYRRGGAHLASTDAVGAFTTSLSDLRVKWERTDDPGYWVPPIAADLDGDGIAEVIATVGNASANPGNPSNPVSVESGLNVINGRTGAMRWSVAPETGYLDFFSPAVGDIDADGQAEIVYFHGQPLTGTSLTNKVVAYEADGTKKWEWSDTGWGSRIALPLTAVTIGDVDGESARNEVVLTLLLAQVTTTISGGKVLIAGSNPEYRLIALNGEGSSASKSWEKVFTGNATASNVALADLNGDGVLDAVHGVGVKPGTLIDTASATITVSAAFADDKVRAWYGGTQATEAWTFNATGYYPGELGTAPAIVDLDGDGSLEIVQPLWVRTIPPTPSEVSTVLVLNADGTERWRTPIQGAIAASIAQVPPAVADLDGDGKKDIVVQVSNGGTDKYRLVALKHDGTVLWRSPSTGIEFTGAPAIGDLTGDGKPEVLAMHGTNLQFSRTQTLFIYNGQTGAELLRKTFEVGSSVGGPILADLDGDDDGRLEILINTGFWGSPGKLIALEPELADLRLTGLAFSTSEHLHGVAETVSATVTNIGNRSANNALVRFTDGAATLHEATLTLAPQASQVVSFTWTPDTVGQRTLRASADPAKAIPEWAETNNDQSATVNVRAPDLKFASLDPVFSDPTPGVGDTISVSATLSNAGGKDATNVLVRFVDGANTFAEQTVASLPKGQSVALSASLLVEGEFDRVVKLIADPAAAIVEESEANNEASKLLDVIFIAPDLTLGTITFSNPTPGGGDTITVSVPVSNGGSKDAGSFVVRFLDEGANFGEVTVPALAEGATQTVSRDLLVLGEFVHTITAIADAANALVEEREDNNLASALLNVLAPDLSIVAGDIALSDPNPDDLDVLTVTATVRNVGTGGRVPKDVRVVVVDQGAEVASATIASIPAGQSGSAAMSYQVHGTGPRTIAVRVDPLGAINELSELNNEAVKDLVLGKLDVTIAMTKQVYGFQEQASGVATLRFHNTGQPLANREFLIPVEYVVRTASGPVPTEQFVQLVGALVAQIEGDVDQTLHVCVAGKCVDSTADVAGQLRQLLGGGSGAGSGGPEVTLRLFTIEARTNNQGLAGFVVPFSLLTALDSFDGVAGLDVCLSGLPGPIDTPAGPVAAPRCATQVGSLPSLPAAANLPGAYRATAAVDWYGHPFAGSAGWNHV